MLTIILCVYNEFERLNLAYDDLKEVLKTFDETTEIIIIDNGSSDGTREWIESLKDHGVIKVFNENNIGKGGSIRKGIKIAKGDYILIHDPDLEYSATDIPCLWRTVKENNSDLGLGSRVLGGENISYKYFQNYLGVAILTKLINLLYNSTISDPATAMKLMKSTFIKQLNLTNTGFNLDFELVVKTLHMGGSISETRISYFPRTKAEGKKLRAWKDGLASLVTIIKVKFSERADMSN